MRRSYLDVMRGIAVLIMVEAHTIDAWTRDADRASYAFGYALILGGFGAPIFLFLAGVAVPLAAGSKTRAWNDSGRAAAAVRRRGWEIFALAFLFRLQAHLLGRGPSLTGLLKVDILNIMGPSIVAAAAVWGWCRSARSRAIAFAAIAAVLAVLTPAVRSAAWLDGLPVLVQSYLRPIPGRTNFTALPEAAFVFAGAVLGTVLDLARTTAAERRVNVWLGVSAAVLACAGYAASWMPSIYDHSDFWTSSPTFFAIRTGVIGAAVAGAFAWEQWVPVSLRVLRLFGRSSLFVYWIHVEMVYGLVANPIRHQLSLQAACVGYVLFTVFLFLLVLLKNEVVARRDRLRLSRHGLHPQQV